MVIAQNIPALRTHLSMLRANRKLSASTERLASGFRINSAKDDPTGLTISNKLSLQIAGIEKASQNTSNGVALIQTAEGALAEVHNMLQRMRELAVQAANETNNADDRDKILIEVSELADEIQATATRTEYNKIKLLNGEGSRITESRKGANFDTSSKDVSISTMLYVSEDVQPGHMQYTIKEAGLPAVLEGEAPGLNNPGTDIPANASLTINGIRIGLDNATDLQKLETQFSEACGFAGVEVKDIGGKRFLISKIAGSNQQISIAGTPELLDHFGLVSTFKPNPKDPSTTIDYPVTGTDAVIENFALYDIEGSSPIANPQTGLNYVSKGNQVTVIGVNGEEIKFSIPVTYDQAASAAADEPRFKYGDNTPATNSKDMFFEFKDYGPIKIQVGGSFNNSVSVYIPKLSAETLGLIEYRNGERYELLNYCTTHSASLAIDQCDDALSMVSDVRARLGALQNRLEATVRALDVASENTISSRSRIRDTDMAKEMTDYAAQDVMYQAGIAILTQANQRPMQILSLLNN